MLNFLNLFQCFVAVYLFLCIPIQRKPDPSTHKGQTRTFHRYPECTVDTCDWTAYHRIHLHCSHLIEGLIQRANAEYSESVFSCRGALTRPGSSTCTITARPSSRRSHTAIHLKQYPCSALLLWLNTMKHACLGEDWLEDSRRSGPLLSVRRETYCRAYVNSLPLSWPVVPVIS